jgi:hypothetical protein
MDARTTMREQYRARSRMYAQVPSFDNILSIEAHLLRVYALYLSITLL